MKPRFLEFCGINSFSERTEIDFTKLLEFGIFGIFGDTGSGKSTILDCISFALYGGVFRARSASTAEIINYRLDKAYVHFEFETIYGGELKVYRAEREIKRKNTVQAARVYEKKGESLFALSDGVRESNALLEKIIGLEQKDFEKCVALPQGEFAQFVKAQRSDRLKLVSRLFDLEAYGERLTKRTNAKYAECMENYRLALARLEPFTSVSEESVRLASEQIRSLENDLNVRQEALSSARAAEKELARLREKRIEAENTERKFAALEREREGIAVLEREIGGLERAAAVVRAAHETAVFTKEAEAAENYCTLALSRKKEADRQAEQAALWDGEAADEEISSLTALCARAERTGKALEKREELARALERTRRDYAEEAARYAGFSYEEEKDKILARLSGLGEEDFAEYMETRGKGALLREEYQTFAREVRELGAKYPAASGEAVLLAEKYEALSDGEKKDFTQIRRDYEARERVRREERENLLALEKKNGLYRAHRERLQRLQTEGLRLKGELSECEKECAADGGISLGEARERLDRKRAEKKRNTELLSRTAKEQAEKNAAFAAAEEKRVAAYNARERSAERLREALSAGGFQTAKEAETLTEKYGEADSAKERVARFREEYAFVSAKRKEFLREDFSVATEERVKEAEASRIRAEEEYGETVRTLAVKRAEHVRAQEELSKKKELERLSALAEKQAELYERLKKLLEGNKFMDFVAEEYLQNVAENASGRLLSLTDGRYFLRYEGGAAGFLAGDNFNGGKTRGVYTLSGGETFLVSLSLALALSEEICLKSLRPVEFFFLDEGFGTLDEKLVDTVMDSLERLKNEHFSIGIISHVEELKHRICRKLTVEKATEQHGSRIYAE